MGVRKKWSAFALRSAPCSRLRRLPKKTKKKSQKNVGEVSSTVPSPRPQVAAFPSCLPLPLPSPVRVSAFFEKCAFYSNHIKFSSFIKCRVLS